MSDSKENSTPIIEENANKTIFDKILVSVVYIFIAFLVVKFIQQNIGLLVQKINHTQDKKSEQFQKKVKTIERLSASLLKTIIVIVSILIVLSLWNISVSPILAGAGIIGITIGLGAQTFLKDVINGLNIMISGNMSIGDHVTIKEYKGVVTDISVNTTTLTSYDGKTIVIPNGYIDVIEIQHQ